MSDLHTCDLLRHEEAVETTLCVIHRITPESFQIFKLHLSIDFFQDHGFILRRICTRNEGPLTGNGGPSG